ncbi:MFS transporter [Streptomyces fructofermentans]|uniref:MFS transporter n=1 Tax=Streptomyces fructofermentans TaxID=152141 RepID=A0A918NSY7_9ACTN|nr:MFS transporter [Streptomyces fructofermentans]GGX93640.1 MFS transporter [Streptomyces fructofermentans]
MATQNAAPAAGPNPGAAADPRRWLVLAVICTAYLMVGLDLTVMNLALPSAQEALEFTNADRQWIVTAYALPFGSLLLFFGRLSDLIGRKESFLIGLSGFAIASAVGGASTGFGMLVAARASQGVFAAMLAPACLALLATTFTDQNEKGKAFGIFSGVVASGAGLGLIIGGALTSALDWRWCLYVNLIFAGIALAGGILLLTKQPKAGGRIDVPGVLVASAGMFCLVYGLSNAAEDSWSAPSTWGFLAAGAALLIAFALWQARAAHPLLPPRIVLDRNRGGAYLTVLLVGTGMFGILLFLIYYMQTTLDYSAITSGVALLPMIVCTTLGAGIGATKLMPKYGPKPLITTGLLISAAGMAWLTGIGVDSGYASDLLGPLMVVGLGMGLIYAAALSTGTSGVDTQDSGIASACISAGQQLGGALGTALLNTIAATAATHWLEDNAKGQPTLQQLQLASIDGYTTVFWWCTAIFAGGAVIAGLLLRSGPLPTPDTAPAASDTAEHTPAEQA